MDSASCSIGSPCSAAVAAQTSPNLPSRLQRVLDQGRCVGCGICAGVCPTRRLAMAWNAYGEYVPTPKAAACVHECGRCAACCPFSEATWSIQHFLQPVFGAVEDIQFQEPVGFWSGAYVGYRRSTEERIQCASGGLLSTTLETMLRAGWVDRVLCVGLGSSSGTRFQYRVVAEPEELSECRGSAYYPVEISSGLQTILQEDLRYAVVGLPCVCRGLRRAMALDRRLQSRIRWLLGLVCGQNKSRSFCNYLCHRAGCTSDEVESVRFRAKDSTRPAWDFSFSCGGRQGRAGRVYWTEGMAFPWVHRYFTLPACNVCDDVFAEAADAVFMDAWLPEYQADWRGYSLALTRSWPSGTLPESLAPVADVTPIPITRLIQSQLGVVESKRSDLLVRLKRHAQETGERALAQDPVRHRDWSFGKGLLIRAEWEACRQSRLLWRECGGDGRTFDEAMGPMVARLQRAEQISRSARVVRALLRRQQTRGWGV